MRPNRRQKITDEEYRTAGKSHCKKIALRSHCRCVWRTQWCDDHNECMARVGQQFMAPSVGHTSVHTGDEFIRPAGRMRHAIRPNLPRRFGLKRRDMQADGTICRSMHVHALSAVASANLINLSWRFVSDSFTIMSVSYTHLTLPTNREV